MLAGFNVPWKKSGEVIRDRETKHPYLIVAIHKNFCTMVVDLEDKSLLPTPKILLPREYEKFVPDWNA